MVLLLHKALNDGMETTNIEKTIRKKKKKFQSRRPNMVVAQTLNAPPRL